MSIAEFIENFNIAVDFQESIAVTPESKLSEMPEWDSLAMLGVIVMFDTDYGKSITGDDIRKCETVQDLYQFSQG